MKLLKHPLHMRSIFYLAIVMISFIPLIVTPIIQYFYTREILNNKINALASEKVQQINLNTSDIIDDIIVGTNVIALDNELLKLIQNVDIDFFSKRRTILSKLQQMEVANLYPYNVITTVLDFEGNVYTTAQTSIKEYPDYTNEDWYKEALQLNGFFLWMAPVDPILDDIGDIKTIAIARVLKRDNGQKCGVMIMHVYLERKIVHILDSAPGLNGEEIFIVNGSGDIILASSEDKLHYYDKELFSQLAETRNQKSMINNESVNINVIIADKTDWKIVQVISNKLIYKETNDFLVKTMLINTILFLITLLLGYYIVNTFTKPIRQLSMLMEESPNSDFKQKSTITGSYEVNKLSESYNFMIDRINILIKDIQFESIEKQKKHLEALQAQINPHFLLNTLNGIKWLCVIEEAKSAEKMILSLGQLLENMYFKNEEIVTLEKEIELLKSYCEIQKMRYGKRFEVEYYIDDKYLDVEVPVLLLQPIVENCILHAVSETEVIVKIDITVYEEHEFIFISIADNGVGMTKKQIDSMLLGKTKDKYGGIGMKNVKDRIQLYYSKQCDLTVQSELSEGTEVVLKIKSKIDKI